ncbi:glycosyltransferase [Granulicella sp. L60]|uniref:glycosyltransferase n=1 Tax=Granulicella sp. L60 TaxID=1641866 RepID=UPI00131C1A49|nr:nucleotide disphospho-sugar-binding domain-containing protein [Granulicella sp. L60]
MANIGFLSLNLTSHLNVGMSLAKELEARGHNVTFFNIPDVKRVVTDRGLRFVEMGSKELPEGTLQPLLEQLSKLQGNDAFAFLFAGMTGLTHIAAGYLPDLLRNEKIDALVIDQLFAGGATVAQHLNIPFASIASAVLLNRWDGAPNPKFSCDYDPSEAGIERNRKHWEQVREEWKPWTDAENIHREAWGLPPFHNMVVDSFSPIAQISQQPKGFDFPRPDLPDHVHYVGPLTHPSIRRSADFDWEKLNGKPLVYASLGTLQNGLNWVYKAILEACAPLDIQLVLSTGGGPVDEAEIGAVPNNALMVNFAPQFDLLARSSLCITHGGLNTAVECLTHGVPMVAVPITHEQPGVAARIRYTNTGRSISLDELDAHRLRELVKDVLVNPLYREQAKKFQLQIAKTNPLKKAADIIERDVVRK